METRRIEMTIAEPWNMTTPDGDNLLFCSADLDNDSGTTDIKEYLLVKSTTFKFKGQIIHSFRLTQRDGNENRPLLFLLRSGARVGVNAGWTKDGEMWTHEKARLSNKEIGSVLGGFFIASAQIV